MFDEREQDSSRVDPMGDSQDSPTASVASGIRPRPARSSVRAGNCAIGEVGELIG